MFETTCRVCRHSFTLTPKTAELVYYQGAPECNQMVSRCPKCETVVSAFIGQNRFTALAVTLKVNCDRADPTPEVRQKWIESNFPPEPELHALTPSLESEVATLARVLESTPADLLFDALTAPAPKPWRPQRWI